MMYTDNSTTDEYPKTLLIKNHKGGMVWQIYHVQKKSEADKLAATAKSNGFYGSVLVDHEPEYEETWPDWRETDSGKKIIKP